MNRFLAVRPKGRQKRSPWREPWVGGDETSSPERATLYCALIENAAPSGLGIRSVLSPGLTTLSYASIALRA